MDVTQDAPLMLSVSGARGIVGQSMNETVAARFARAFATHVIESTGAERPLFCIGRDSRASGPALLESAAAGLASVGARIVDVGLAATPTVGVAVAERGAAGGLVVTASHNPLPWNGLKCIDGAGGAPPGDVAAEIIERFRAEQPGGAHRAAAAIELDETASTRHVDRVLRHVDADPIRAARFTVALDSVNGAGGPAGRMLLESLGCTVVHLNAEPTGAFAHTPEPLAENLGDLMARTSASGADVGFAQDPDGDRLAVVDGRGRYLGEELTLVLAARRVLQVRGHGVLVANLSTSRMIDDLAAAHDATEVIRTAVGEANVVAAMRSAGAIFGGEGNGGVILPEVCWIRDSLSAMALVLGLMAAEAEPLGAIVDRMPRYAMVKHRFELSGADRARRAEVVENAIARIAARHPDARLDTTDGVRIDLEEGWVHLRQSNTEPIVRLIAEAETAERADALVAEIAELAGL